MTLYVIFCRVPIRLWRGQRQRPAPPLHLRVQNLRPAHRRCCTSLRAAAMTSGHSNSNHRYAIVIKSHLHVPCTHLTQTPALHLIPSESCALSGCKLYLPVCSLPPLVWGHVDRPPLKRWRCSGNSSKPRRRSSHALGKALRYGTYPTYIFRNTVYRKLYFPTTF